MSEIQNFLNMNGLWTMKTHRLDLIGKPISKNTPIYITGDFGPQGKTTLKNLLIKDGYTHVLEMEEVYNFVREISEHQIKPEKKRQLEQFVKGEMK